MSTHALARVQTADTQSLPQRDAERMTVFKISSVTVLFMAGAVDKAAAKGILHKNNAAHKKSAMTLKLNSIG